MKPRPFAYRRAGSVEEALSALSGEPDAMLLAGGQSLMAMLNMRLAGPSHLIDIGHIDALRGIEERDGGLRLGALTRHAELETDEIVARVAPMLARAARELAHPAIRNRGTLGGSLALADPAAELPACMLALGGTIELASSGGSRSVAAADFFTGAFETARAANELIAAVALPDQAGRRWAYRKLARRNGDYAMAGIAMTAAVDSGALSAVRIAVFGVADRPVLVADAAQALDGSTGDGAAQQDAGEVELGGARQAGLVGRCDVACQGRDGSVESRAVADLLAG